MTILKNKAKFITQINSGQLVIQRKAKDEIIQTLVHDGYHSQAAIDAIDSDQFYKQEHDTSPNYDYLLGMPLWALTQERVEQIESQLKAKKEQVAELEKATI